MLADQQGHHTHVISAKTPLVKVINDIFAILISTLQSIKPPR